MNSVGRLVGVVGLVVFLSDAHVVSGGAITLAAFGQRVIVPGRSAGVSNGDTWDGAWSTNGFVYLQHNDGTGFDTALYVHDRICRLSGTPQMPWTLAGTNLNPGVVGTSLNGSPCYSTGIYEVDGVLYHNLCYSQQIPGAWVFHHTSMIKSTDGGKTWINHLGQVNVIPPDSATNCFFTSDAWGEVNFLKYGPGGTAPNIDNAQTYIYLTAAMSDFRLARVRRADLPKLDRSTIQYYVGGDGMFDSSWTNAIAQSRPTPVPSISPTAVVYNPGLGRYLMTSFSSDSWQTPPIESTLRVMEAPHPWGPWSLVLEENVNNFENDNLTWAFLFPKFTSLDGKKMWVSTSGRAPYGLQFVPVYLATEPVQIQEAESSVITGGFVTNTVAGYSGRGYVSGLDAVGKGCDFAFNVTNTGAYIVQFRYDTSGYRNIGLYVNGAERSSLKLGKSEQVYATWTSMSTLSWLAAGTNHISLRCVDNLGNINLDNVSLALYSTNGLSNLVITHGQGAGLNFDPVPGLNYRVEWKSNLVTQTAWQLLTNIVGGENTVEITHPSMPPAGFMKLDLVQ